MYNNNYKKKKLSNNINVLTMYNYCCFKNFKKKVRESILNGCDKITT